MNYKKAKLNDANNDLSQQWFIYFYYIHPDTGKYFRFRKWISKKILTKTGRRDKAHELIKEINTRLQQGWDPFAESESRLTNIKDAIELALKVKSKTVGKRSRHTYNSIAGMFIRYLEKNKLQNISISDINYKIVQDFFDNSLISESISHRTYNNRISALKTIFNFLVKREYLVFNPVNRIDKLPEHDPELSAYNKSELKLISEKLPIYDFQLYVISQFIFYCFIRPAELVRLQFKDLFWDHQLIIVPGHKSKNKKSEPIILPDQLVANLKKWERNYPGDWYLFSQKLLPGKIQIAPTRIAEAWRSFADHHNISKGIYDLKHTGNGMAFDLGMNSRDIQLQNRHHSLEQTQQYLNKFRRIPSEKFKTEFKGF